MLIAHDPTKGNPSKIFEIKDVPTALNVNCCYLVFNECPEMYFKRCLLSFTGRYRNKVAQCIAARGAIKLGNMPPVALSVRLTSVTADLPGNST